MDKEFLVAVKKRAAGFTSVEETVEYELVKAKKYLLCKKKNRLYFGGGFINLVCYNNKGRFKLFNNSCKFAGLRFSGQKLA